MRFNFKNYDVRRMLLILFVLFLCVGCDQVTKTMARQNLPESEVIRLLNDTVRLLYTENPGAFLSLGANIPETMRYWVFTIAVGLFLAGLLIYLLITTQLTRYQTLAMALILGGGIGNLIDRVFNNGRVIDFMNAGIGSLRTGIFNVADLAITFGVIFYLIVSLKESRKPTAMR